MARKVSSRDSRQYGAALEVCPTLTLKRTSRAIAKYYDDMLRDAGVSSGQLAMLLATARDGSTTYARLSRELLIDATAVGRAVRTLQARGLVSVDEIEGSLRKKVVITEAGIECLRKAVPLWKAATDQFFESVDKANWQRVREELSHLSSIHDQLGS